MKLLVLAAVVAIAAVAAWLAFEDDAESPESAVVARVTDGDTIVLVGGERVRLVQIDTPEKGKECYAEQATALVRTLLPPGTRIRIEVDPRLDQVDRFGRTLGYVVKDGENVNVMLVRRGAASVWFYRGARGRHAEVLLEAARKARAEGRGLWAACPSARFDPLAAVSTGPS